MTRNKLPAAIDAELAKEFKFGTESENTKWFCDVAERYNVQHYALAGSVFQMGLPDRLFICPDGNIRLIEFKRDARRTSQILRHDESERSLLSHYRDRTESVVQQMQPYRHMDLSNLWLDWKQLNLRGAQHRLLLEAAKLTKHAHDEATKIHRAVDTCCLVVVQGETPDSWVSFEYNVDRDAYYPRGYGVAYVLEWLVDGGL